VREQKLYIGGEWISGSRTEQVHDRWSSEPVGIVHVATAEHARAAVSAASAALATGISIPERARILEAVSAQIASRAEEFARSITAETGKPITASRGEVLRSIGTFRLAAEEARRLPSETVPMDSTELGAGMIGFTIAQPRGIVAAITPFNFPLNLVAHKVGPAIAAGCAVLLKPSDKARLTAGLLVEAFEAAGTPPGFLNLVTGAPSEVVSPWQEDDRVAVVTFTGSSKVGWQLKATSPQKIHILELGSNTAMVVAGDADVDRAARDTVTAALSNSGQACVSLQRVYVFEGVADAYVEAVASKFREVSSGDPNLPETLVGPLVSDAELSRITSWLDEAVSGGARILVGGVVDGTVLAPTLVVDTQEHDRIVCEEVFGPVVTVVRVTGLDDAIQRVNDSRYGLNTSIYTKDLAMSLRFAREAEAGSVLVNVLPSFRADFMPYGGVKDSGQGREGVKYAIAELVEQKLVILSA
jgi:acyl-CoA reductase-like NAD-dependent aldehyde dehydrogenase